GALPANWTRMAPSTRPPGRRPRRVTSAPTTLATSCRTSAGSGSGWVPWFMTCGLTRDSLGQLIGVRFHPLDLERSLVQHAAKVVVTDRLGWLARVGVPLAAGPRKRCCGIVIRTDEPAQMHEHLVTPEVVGGTHVEAAPLIGDEAVASHDLSLDVGQNLAPLL